MWELSTETNGIEMAVVGFGVASIFAAVLETNLLIDGINYIDSSFNCNDTKI